MLVTNEIARLNGVISIEECGLNKGREPSQLYSYNAQITDYYASGIYFFGTYTDQVQNIFSIYAN